MNLLIVSQGYPPFVQGGAEIQTQEEAHALQSKFNIDVSIFTTSHASSTFKEGNVTVYSLKKPFKLGKRRARILMHALNIFDFRFFPYFRALLEKISPNVVYFHKLAPHLSYSLIPVAKRLRIPSVFVVKDLYCVCKRYTLMNRHKRLCSGPSEIKCLKCLRFRGYLPFRTKLVKKMLLKTDKIIVRSNFNKKMLIKLHYPEDKIVVIPPYFSIPTNLSEYKVKKKDKSILYVGRLSIEKGVIYLIKAFARVVREIPTSSLFVVGDGPEGNKLSTLVMSYGLQSKVKFVGYITHQKVYDWYKMTDVVVSPSICHEYTKSILEALHMKKPIVATRVGGTPEVVKNKETGLLVPPRDVKELAKAIKYLLENEEEAKKMAEAGHNFFLTHFNPQQSINEVYNLLKSLSQ